MNVRPAAFLGFALLASCSGSNETKVAPWSPLLHGAGPPNVRAIPASVPPAPDRGPSWMLPVAKKTALLYISDVRTGDIDVYAYPKGSLRGKLTGFGEPQGECTAPNGNVWIVDTAKAQLREYPHGGTTPVATLKDPGEYPAGCAVDAAGDVAVTNIATVRGGPGSIAWYAGGTGQPSLIASPSFQEMYFDGFDPAGNLFVDGWPPNFAQAEVGELPSGGNAIVPLTVSGATIRYPGGVQFDRNAVNVGDQVDDAVFHIAENGTVTGYTPLDGASDCVQGTIGDGRYVCPDSVNGAVEYFRYPAGGAATHVISTLSEPTGSAISTH
jgi:hypothetical protein